MVFKVSLGKELRNKFSKMSNEKELSNFTYFSYFFILTESIVIYAIKRNRRYQKDCWHCEKNSKELKRSQQTSFRKPRKKCSRVFFMKIRTNSHVSQGDKAYFTESFRNRKIALLVCSPIKYTITFFFKKSLIKTIWRLLLEKIKDGKVGY